MTHDVLAPLPLDPTSSKVRYAASRRAEAIRSDALAYAERLASGGVRDEDDVLWIMLSRLCNEAEICRELFGQEVRP